MRQYKIIVTGPVGAGKTTAIKTLSDIPPVKTDVVSNDKSKKLKERTTVAMDYGIMQINDSEKLHLYGTPGQERFNFMWDILTSGGVGLILLLDNTRLDPFRDMHFFLNAFSQYISDTRVVIGVTQMDLNNKPGIDDYQNQFRHSKLKPEVLSIDARIKNDVSKLVQTLLFSLEP